MENKDLLINSRINKLRKLNIYESLWVDFSRIMKQVEDEDLNVMSYRSNLKMLIHKMIKEITDYEYYFLNMLSCLETPHTFISHSLNTAIFSFILSSYLDVDSRMVPKIMQASLLHDVGKIDFSEKIKELYVFKDEDVTQVAKNHPVWGERILLYHLKTDPDIARLVLNHHEQNDGSGFPRGLKGTDLSISDHIVMTANLLDNVLQKIKYSCLEALAANIGTIMETKGQKFADPVKDALNAMFSLKNDSRTRRRYRISAKGKVENESLNLSMPCEILNISYDGLGIAVPVVLNTGMVYKINSKISSEDYLKDKFCQVMWNGLSGGKFVYGMKCNVPNDSIISHIVSPL